MTAPKEIALANLAKAGDDFWNDARIGALVRLARAGYSYAEIGAYIGASRGQVAGKADRLGLSANGFARLRTRQAELKLAWQRSTIRDRYRSAKRAADAKLEALRREAQAIGVEL